MQRCILCALCCLRTPTGKFFYLVSFMLLCSASLLLYECHEWSAGLISACLRRWSRSCFRSEYCQGCQTVTNLANITNSYSIPKELPIFWQCFVCQNFNIAWNASCRYWQNNPFWIIYQMNIQILKMKNSSKLMVLNCNSDHPPISAKHIHCCRAFK